jgi:hypothetical protein
MRAFCDRLFSTLPRDPVRNWLPALPSVVSGHLVGSLGFFQSHGTIKDSYFCQFHFITYIFCCFDEVSSPDAPDLIGEKSNRQLILRYSRRLDVEKVEIFHGLGTMARGCLKRYLFLRNLLI